MGKPISFEGRTIEVPDDATDAEVATILSSYPQQGFETLPGGAAIVQPRQPARPLRGPTGTELITDIGGATALGAGMGLVAPEIIQGVGMGLKAFPGTAPLGSGIEFLGRAARAAGPAARVTSGAVSGAGSETAGKIAEGLGAKPGGLVAEGARFVGGGITPEFARVAGTLIANILSHYAMPGRIDAAAMRTLAGRISRGISQGTGQPLTEYEQAYVAKLVADVQGSRNPGEALKAIGAEMQAGAENVLETGERRAADIVTSAKNKNALDLQRETQIANQRLAATNTRAGALHTEANAALNEAETAARAELAAAEKRVVPYGQATDYLARLKNQTTDAAKKTRLEIGRERPLGNTEIGNELRNVAVKRENNFRTAASERYAATAADVNTEVAKLEASGLRVNSVPAYKDLVAYLQNQLKPGIRSADVAAGYKKILDQITVKAEEGVPTVSPSFKAIDDARRLMGESFRGKPAEGYAAIDAKARKDIYGKLSKIQENFAGPKQTQLLADYADSRPELAAFGSKAGQQLTALDRGALEQFATDPSKMPGYFFKTPTAFQNLVELVGDKALATQAGLDHIAAELAAKDTSAKVRSWMTTNREMLNAVPGAKANVVKYANFLEAAEKQNASIDAGIKKLTERQTGLRSTATSKASDIRAGGAVQRNELAKQANAIAAAGETESNALVARAATEAKALTTAAEARAGVVSQESAAAANKIWNRASASPQFNARKLIEDGDATQWSLVAPIIQRSPTGKRDIYDALRETLADRLSSGNVKGATQRFNEVISPGMVKMGLLDASAAKKFSEQLARIEAQRVPSPEELGVWNRMLLQAVAGYASSLGSRGLNAGFSLVSDIPTGLPPKTNALAPQNNNLAR
jgi:hypothetical protein